MNVPTVLESFKEKIELTDFDQDFKVYSYTSCSNESSEELKKLRGMIFTHDDRLIHSTQYTNEYNVNGILPAFDYSNCHFTVSYEGTIVRMFFNTYTSNWKISTNRKLDAYSSSWSNEGISFGEQFEQDIQPLSMLDLVNHLDPQFVYLFFMRSNASTRLVCQPVSEDEPKIFFVGKAPVGKPDLFEPSTENIGLIPCQPKLVITCEQDLRNAMHTINWKYAQGILIYNKKTGVYSKVMDSEYVTYRQARGNEPSIFYRYLQLQKPSEEQLYLFELFPELIPEFALWDECEHLVTRKIHKEYIRRYVHKEFETLPPTVHYILKQAHQKHLNNREYKVTMHTIHTLLRENLQILFNLIKEEL